MPKRKINKLILKKNISLSEALDSKQPYPWIKNLKKKELTALLHSSLKGKENINFQNNKRDFFSKLSFKTKKYNKTVLAKHIVFCAKMNSTTNEILKLDLLFCSLMKNTDLFHRFDSKTKKCVLKTIEKLLYNNYVKYEENPVCLNFENFICKLTSHGSSRSLHSLLSKSIITLIYKL